MCSMGESCFRKPQTNPSLHVAVRSMFLFWLLHNIAIAHDWLSLPGISFVKRNHELEGRVRSA